MADPGRPRALDDTKRSEVVALIATGYGIVGAAKYVGCTAKTIRREAARDPEFAQQLREAEKQAKLSPLEAIRHKAHTHWRAAAWLLERTEPKRYAKPEKRLLKPGELDRLVELVLDRFIQEVSKDPFGEMWYRDAIIEAKNQVMKGLPRHQDELRRLVGRAKEYVAAKGCAANEEQSR